MIPVWINNRNRLTTTRRMVEYLLESADAEPIVIDNDSTYPPLLDWYSSLRGVRVVRQHCNAGAYGPWRISNLACGGNYYVVTDSDLDLSSVPRDLLSVLRDGLDSYQDVVKAGLSLEIADLPKGTTATRRFRVSEAAYWKIRRGDWWVAPIDTTFAMYRASSVRFPARGPALRADRPYTARHIPWYRILDDEERYYEAHADRRWASSLATLAGRRRKQTAP